MIGVGVGVGIDAVQGSSVYTFTNTEASDLVARMTTPPTNARKALIDTFVGALKTAGVWSKQDVIHVFAAADAQAACLNWKGATNTAVPNASPTFTADRGYTGDGAASFLQSGAVPGSLSNFAQNSANLGVWLLTNATGGYIAIGGGTGTCRITPRNGTQMTARICDGTTLAANLPSSTSAGLTSANRSGSAVRRLYKNGVDIGGDTQASQAVAATEFLYLKDAAVFAPHQIAIGFIGGSLTAAEELARYNAALAYLQAVGTA